MIWFVINRKYCLVGNRISSSWNFYVFWERCRRLSSESNEKVKVHFRNCNRVESSWSNFIHDICFGASVTERETIRKEIIVFKAPNQFYECLWWSFRICNSGKRFWKLLSKENLLSKAYPSNWLNCQWKQHNTILKFAKFELWANEFEQMAFHCCAFLDIVLCKLPSIFEFVHPCKENS